MNDTHPEIGKVYRKILMERSGPERFRMGLEMYEMAKAIMLAGLREESEVDIESRAFLRLYGDEFEGRELREILRRIRESLPGA